MRMFFSVTIVVFLWVIVYAVGLDEDDMNKPQVRYSTVTWLHCVYRNRLEFLRFGGKVNMTVFDI